MRILFSIVFILMAYGLISEESFISKQKKFERVRMAFSEKEQLVSGWLREKSISYDKLNILIIAYKDERKLELFAKNRGDSDYVKIRSYDICSSSGNLGPKVKGGDGQVPEGFYYINRFNPQSSFYLSLGINYPNETDKKRSKGVNPGGDIFIHGECVTIGCLPMTNDKIKEIYLLSVHAKASGQEKIPVYIFPFRMTDENLKKYSESYKDDKALIKFWKELKNNSRCKYF